MVAFTVLPTTTFAAGTNDSKPFSTPTITTNFSLTVEGTSNAGTVTISLLECATRSGTYDAFAVFRSSGGSFYFSMDFGNSSFLNYLKVEIISTDSVTITVTGQAV